MAGSPWPARSERVASLVRFAPELGRWLTQSLDRGQTPQALLDTMRRQGMDARAARAIVEAFVDARGRGQPAPVDHVELPGHETPAPARLAPGTRLRAAGREILVHADTGSFPSGHTANAATMVVVLGILFPRVWVWCLGVAWAVLMALAPVTTIHWSPSKTRISPWLSTVDPVWTVVLPAGSAAGPL